jgi:hypothetical protein
MALTNKAAIESEYASKAAAIEAITPAAVDATLAPVVAFIVQNEECMKVLLAREVLNGRSTSSGQISSLAAVVAQLRTGEELIRSAVPAIQAALTVIG